MILQASHFLLLPNLMDSPSLLYTRSLARSLSNESKFFSLNRGANLGEIGSNLLQLNGLKEKRTSTRELELGKAN